jgi:phospholipid/cholesterol/gamma-HCH transport system substrate-binding protein
METRARYALIGLFILAVIAGSFAFVYWLENKGGFGQRETYNVRFEGPVSGLSVGSAVLFNGLRVGEVTALSLNPAEPQTVIASVAVQQGTPIRDDTKVGLEQQGLTGGAAVTLRGGTSTSPLASSQGGALPLLSAPATAGQDWTQAARDAFQNVDKVMTENSESLKSAISNIDTFAEALARNADKVDSILAGIERMTGGSSATKTPLYDLAAAKDFPPPPAEAPAWQLVIPEPSTLLGINTDKILTQPAAGQVAELPTAKWTDNLPVLVQAKVVQSFENAGYARSVSRPRDNVTDADQLVLDIRRFQVATSPEAQGEIDFVAKIITADGKVLDAHEFKTTAPASGTDAEASVAALNAAFAKLMPELIDWTVATLKNKPQPPAPEAGGEAPAELDMPPEPEMPPEPAEPSEPAAPDNTL